MGCFDFVHGKERLRSSTTCTYFRALYYGHFKCKFYNMLYVVSVVLPSFFSAITFDWIELQKWFIPLWKAKKLL